MLRDLTTDWLGQAGVVLLLISIGVASLTTLIKHSEFRRPPCGIVEATKSGCVGVSKGVQIFDIAKDEKAGFPSPNVLDLFWTKTVNLAFQIRGLGRARIGLASGQQPQPGAIVPFHLRIAGNFRKAKFWRIIPKGRRYVYLDDLAGVRPVFVT